MPVVMPSVRNSESGLGAEFEKGKMAMEWMAAPAVFVRLNRTRTMNSARQKSQAADNKRTNAAIPNQTNFVRFR
jgi:hypothetical protein